MMSYKTLLDEIERREKIKRFFRIGCALIIIFAFMAANYFYQKNTKRQSIQEAQFGKVISNTHFAKRSGSYFQCKVFLDEKKVEIDAFCFSDCLVGDKVKVIEVIRPGGGVAYEALVCSR